VKNNILKAEKLTDEKFFSNDLKNNIHRSDALQAKAAF
jgi:hypothetical protein